MGWENIINEQLSSMNLDQLEELMGAASQNGSLFGGVSPKEIITSIANGTPIVDFQVIMGKLAGYFLQEIYSSLILAVQLVVICILIGLLKNMASSFGESTVSSLGAVICSCAVIALCLRNFMEIYALCGSSIDTMVMAMQALLPIMVTLLLSMGSFASGGVLNPVIMAAITMFSTILQRYILPAVFLSCIFFLVNSLTERDYVKKLASFLRSFAIFAMGLSVTLFSGLTAIQGLVTKSADGMIAKTAKFSVDNFVPIVGGFAADSIDMILSCTNIIKNGVGIFGLFILLTLLLVPLLKLLAIALVYKGAAIVIEPIGNKTVSDCLNEVGNTIITMAVILFLAAMMFLIFLTILISIGGGTGLWR